ncbi:MAG: prolyl oligopeptidase family serine peptidase [Clostridia bacterium]|nr:prolyl oligopeptidase family serine peptidase [Clostridia bacterium]
MNTNLALPRITKETVEQFAFTNKGILRGKAKAIVLDFHGLGSCELRNKYSDLDIMCADNGVLCVYPYYGPWSWMNSDAVKYVDEIVLALCDREELDINNVTIISTGGSMGGLSALIYSRYAAVTPKACFANCPVCDLLYHATERPDLPRTVYLAFNYSDISLEDAVRNNSPLHQVKNMPNIKYYIIHGTADTAVNMEMHSNRFVDAMRKENKAIEYITVDNMWHCDINSFPSVKEKYFAEIIKAAKE